MKPHITVVGDVMLDEYNYGDVHRISPEAATPILNTKRTVRTIGGAGNVAKGIAALGAHCDFVSVIGTDDPGHIISAELHTGHVTPWLAVKPGRQTTYKKRFVSEQHSSHLLRVDMEQTDPIGSDTVKAVMRNAMVCLSDPDCRVLVISDYCKGVITDGVAIQLIGLARGKGIIVIVDSKRENLSVFKGANYLKVNLCELGFCYGEPDQQAIDKAAGALASRIDVDHVIVTRGERGLSLYPRHTSKLELPEILRTIHVPGRIVRVRDVSGAGDTVVATLAVELAEGAALEIALDRANHAAAIAVGKPGTATVSLAELRGRAKIAAAGDWGLLDQRLKEWRGQKIGFTNGCFDLLHSGHIRLLERARAECDKLIVGLNSDDSKVWASKGPGRPVNHMGERADMLAALDIVDLVVLFDEDDPTMLCKCIRPDVLFKGSDYQPHEIAGRLWAKTVHIFEREKDGQSTTAIIDRIKAGVQCEQI